MSTRYGLIGLGNVGADLARDAVSAGLDVSAFDIDRAALDRAVDAGVAPRADASMVAAEADVLILSLPNSPIVDRVLADGVFDSLRPGSLLIDMSTNLPARAVSLAAEGRDRGIRVIDAPVTYGQHGLVSYVGGAGADLEHAATWLDASVVEWIHVGPNGHGQYAKLAQNMLSGVGMGIVAEVLGFARAAGLDPGTLHDALRPTGAYSGLIERVLPAMQERRYGSAGTMALHAKDMGYALQTAGDLDVRLPFTAALHDVFEQVLSVGDRRWGQTALIEWWSPSTARPDDGRGAAA
ncbi:NAD(P)-dependent oxidoreductase [Agromyces silvae]|uniref:NAD(P)-dependent oxidoreductase n=1 Tax=Agromyces silvae TaxID=3388266 RepID=UPI00280B705A|nr:NAD(P)-dependent oxidoreductase [Agromyces protaetiae]